MLEIENPLIRKYQIYPWVSLEVNDNRANRNPYRVDTDIEISGEPGAISDRNQFYWPVSSFVVDTHTPQ